MKQQKIDNLFKVQKSVSSYESEHKRRRSNPEPDINEDNIISSTSMAFTIECDFTPPDTHKEAEPIFIPDSPDLFSSHNANEQEFDPSDDDAKTNMEVDVSPNIVGFIHTASPNRVRRKPTKSQATLGSSFILETIELYDKHLKKSDAFNGILKDESLNLLSKWVDISEGNKKIISYLYCIDHNEGEWISEERAREIALEVEEIDISLSEKGFLTFSPADADQLSIGQCLELLAAPQLQKVCEKFNLITRRKKRTHKEILRTYITTRDIRTFSNNTTMNPVEKKAQILNYMISKVKKWKLSVLARDTITELSVLMHLDHHDRHSCSIGFTNEEKDRPEIKFKPPQNTKSYPVDKNMIVDNASIVFQNRKEFCAYLQALAFSEEYKAIKSVEKEHKEQTVLRALESYENVPQENMSRYKELPPWLRRFTSVYIYLEILDDGWELLKKSKKYENTLKILDLLIAQVAFKQYKKAEWYNEKIHIYQKYWKSTEKVVETLYEAFKADLPEESVDILRQRADELMRTYKNTSGIEKNFLVVLKSNAAKKLSEGLDCDKIPQEYTKNSKSNDTKLKQRCETVCSDYYKKKGFTLVEHYEGHLMNTIYFLLFWDIIYAKPLGVGGIFLSHYQQYPLDMWCESFYTNRKAIIDDLLTILEKCTVEDIIKMITNRYEKLIEYDIPEMNRNVNNCDAIVTVVRCLGPRALAAICRRLVQNYHYTRCGFPDLTLCNADTGHCEFREVKTTRDRLRPNQLLWLHYLKDHDIKAGIAFYDDKQGHNTTQDIGSEQQMDITTPPVKEDQPSEEGAPVSSSDQV